MHKIYAKTNSTLENVETIAILCENDTFLKKTKLFTKHMNSSCYAGTASVAGGNWVPRVFKTQFGLVEIVSFWTRRNLFSICTSGNSVLIWTRRN